MKIRWKRIAVAVCVVALGTGVVLGAIAMRPPELHAYEATICNSQFANRLAAPYRVDDANRARLVHLATQLLGRERMRCWPGSVAVLGALADAEAVDLLIAFIESDTARELDSDGYKAVGLAHWYLGILGRRHPETRDRVLTYLSVQLEEANHIHRQFGWTMASQPNRRALHSRFRPFALMGVASLGSQAARSVLRSAEAAHTFEPTLLTGAYKVWQRSR